MDLISGDRYGNFFYFENTGSSSSPAFAAASTNPFGLSGIGYRSAPAFVDLDGDGDLDLLSGTGYGYFVYLENKGFATASTNPFGLSSTSNRSAPSFADLDGDGDLDLLSGASSGDFVYFENTGTSSAPAFAAASTNPFRLGNIGYDSAPAFADLDGDGDMDLISGTGYENFVYFENITEPAAGPAPAALLSLSTAFGAPGDTLRISAHLTNTEPVAGLQAAVLLDDPDAAHIAGLEDTTANPGFTVSPFTSGDSTRLVLHTDTGALIDPGEARLLSTLVYAIDPDAPLGSTIALTLADVEIGDALGMALAHDTADGQLQIGIRGDVNLDRRVSILDVIRTVRIILEQDPVPSAGTTAFRIADMNDDGAIDVADVIRQVNAILGIVTKPVASGALVPVVVGLEAAGALSVGGPGVPLVVDSDGQIAGVQAVLRFDPGLVSVGAARLPGEASGLAIDSHVKGGLLRVVVYPLQPGAGLSAGRQVAFYVPVTLRQGAEGTPELSLSEVVLAGAQAQRLPVQVGTVRVDVSGKGAGLPLAFSLGQARPNPFNPSTTISYEVPQSAHIRLIVYNLLGQEVVRLVDGMQPAGRYEAIWDGRNGRGQGVASGVYVYRMTSSSGFAAVRRMTLVK
jgi:hypothetical protein